MKQSVDQSPEFLALVRERSTVSSLLSFLMMGAYFAFILVLALKPVLLSEHTICTIPVGLYVGVGLILLAWVLTGLYVIWANRSYDHKVRRLRERHDSGKRSKP